jgi:hypothetical protein
MNDEEREQERFERGLAWATGAGIVVAIIYLFREMTS